MDREKLAALDYRAAEAGSVLLSSAYPRDRALPVDPIVRRSAVVRFPIERTADGEEALVMSPKCNTLFVERRLHPPRGPASLAAAAVRSLPLVNRRAKTANFRDSPLSVSTFSSGTRAFISATIVPLARDDRKDPAGPSWPRNRE